MGPTASSGSPGSACRHIINKPPARSSGPSPREASREAAPPAPPAPPSSPASSRGCGGTRPARPRDPASRRPVPFPWRRGPPACGGPPGVERCGHGPRKTGPPRAAAPPPPRPSVPGAGWRGVQVRGARPWHSGHALGQGEGRAATLQLSPSCFSVQLG